MKCPECDGKGFVYNALGNFNEDCGICHGTGEINAFIPQTNEKWIRSMNTEQLAEFLWNYTHDIIFDYERIRNPVLRNMPLKNILGDNCTKKEAWVEWLKQPHQGGES